MKHELHSASGPLLFIIDLLSLTLNGKIICFADDTVLLVPDKSYNELYSRANKIVNYVITIQDVLTNKL